MRRFRWVNHAFRPVVTPLGRGSRRLGGDRAREKNLKSRAEKADHTSMTFTQLSYESMLLFGGGGVLALLVVARLLVRG